MLSKGFKEQIYDVYRYLPPETQVVLVSATLPHEVRLSLSLFRARSRGSCTSMLNNSMTSRVERRTEREESQRDPTSPHAKRKLVHVSRSESV